MTTGSAHDLSLSWNGSGTVVDAAFEVSDEGLRQLVRAMAVPVLVADYTLVIERHRDLSAEEVVCVLDDSAELIRSVGLIPARAESRPWAKLYGSTGPEEVPPLAERLANPAEYPRLKADMIEQLTAPWRGVTSIVQEHSVPTSWGTEVIVRSHWNVMLRDGEPDWSRVVIVDLDVTDLRTAEHNLAQANRLEAIGAMAAGVAHELNTPLQFIGDNLRFLADNLPAIEDLMRHTLAIADTGQHPELAKAVADADVEFLLDEFPAMISESLEGTDTMSNIVRALKDFSHPGTGEREPVDLNAIVENSVAMCRNEWKHAAEITTRLAPSLPQVQAYPQELRQVMVNLLVNAAHAIAHHHTDGSLGTITIATSVAGSYATVSIADDGGGIPESIRGRVFDPFFTTKAVGEGTGQGLAIARQVVVGRHDGRLDLEVTEGIGSTFHIKLPRG